jgi:hypothetical protein
MEQEVDLPLWNANILRFTGFPVPSASILQATWWHELIGQPPDNELFQAKIGVKHLEGETGIGQLILELTQQRIDWLLNSNDQNSIIQNTVGEFTNVINEFSSLIDKWLQFESIPKFRRIAFGSVLTLPVENKVAGYTQIQKFLPNTQLDYVGSTDFLYQINRPRPSRTGIANLKINRLSKWSVVTGVLIPLTPGMTRIETHMQDFACRLEMDINSAADYEEEINPEVARTIFQELIELAIEISKLGDIS